ncbi:heavy metal-associated isoprenylated plant protein 7-like isoform X2 [Lotus japonicus]|uniref:heavy metal-associated isoprenylated plant protein 7-like isoform X2 n=1 Tax=Lotus japonicus TaxID=34305 RepID=UPI0025885722|nr:heavy metal-associated isoprenylated plant protein 7-like isoform X2 [Lotus japonicus]
MGEEEKKPEETKVEEKKEAEEPKKPEEEKEEKKEEETKAEPSPPPEIVLKVFMHCEGCARKVRRSLKGFPGVEDVITDCKSHKVVVKGDKADPVKVLERVQRKSHRHVELLSPIPKPPEEKKIQEEEAKPEPEKKKEEVVTVVLRVHMHCEACAQEMKRRIQRMKGVESVEPDLKNSQVIVKGVYDPTMLVTYVYKRCGKHAVIVKQEPVKAEEAKEEKKAEDGEKKEEKKSEGEGKKEEEKSDGKAGEKIEDAAATTTIEETVVAEVKKYEYDYNPQSYGMNLYAYPAHDHPTYDHHAYPPPQMFSDENPNACTVM